MKLSSFGFELPQELIANYPLPSREDARLMAGGQTLVPLMAMRLARPTLLIDINGIAEMSGIAIDGTWLIIGAGTRQADVRESESAKSHAPLLADALANWAMLMGPERFLTEALPVTIRASKPNVDPVRRHVSAAAADRPSSGP